MNHDQLDQTVVHLSSIKYSAFYVVFDYVWTVFSSPDSYQNLKDAQELAEAYAEDLTDNQIVFLENLELITDRTSYHAVTERGLVSDAFDEIEASLI